MRVSVLIDPAPTPAPPPLLLSTAAGRDLRPRYGGYYEGRRVAIFIRNVGESINPSITTALRNVFP